MTKKPEDIKILVVGDPASVHTARFTSLLQEIGYKVEVFQSEIYYSQDEYLKKTKIHVAFPYGKVVNGNLIQGANLIINEFMSFLPERSQLRRLAELGLTYYYLQKKDIRSRHLIKVLKNFRPDIVFSLKMQNDGYTVAKAKEVMGINFKAKWVHFSWGTDMEFFGKHPNYKKEHLPKIKRLLALCDFHIADCERDVKQAKKLGLKGVSLGTCLAFGGFDLEEIVKIRKRYHRRNFIIVKGRQGSYVGKGFNILAALREISPMLRKFKVKIIYCNPEVKSVVSFLNKFEDTNYEIIDWLPYKKLLNLYAQSILAISATDIDGSPSFLLESMALGAFPIHSDMESIREWIKDTNNGLLFPVDDIGKLTSCIKKALHDSYLIKRAQMINWRIAQQKMDRNKIRNHFRDLIENQVLIQK